MSNPNPREQDELGCSVVGKGLGLILICCSFIIKADLHWGPLAQLVRAQS